MTRLLIASTLCTAVLALMTLAPAFAAVRPATGPGGFTGAGSTADAPLFSNVFNAYCGSPSCINYSALGSGTGQKDLDAGNVDFGCFDVPMLGTDGFTHFHKVVQFPVALFGVSIIYNLSGYHGKLKLTGNDLALIYEGKIKKWNDKRLVSTNPGLKKVKTTVIPVVRSDSSGTSYAYSSYLAAVSKGFVKHYGKANVPSKTPPWPSSFPGGKGSSGVAGVVGNQNGSIGYVETTYYQYNTGQFNEAWIKSKNNTWLLPTNKTVASDASHIGKISPSHFEIVNAPGANSYPISTFSWCGMYGKSKNNPGTTAGRTKNAVKFFKWEVSTGEEKYGPKLTYPAYPTNIRRFAINQLAKIKG